MGLQLYEAFTHADHFGGFPAECTARAVGHDATILYDRPSEVAPHARTRQDIRPDLCAFGDRLLDILRHASLQCEIGLTSFCNLHTKTN